MNHKYYVVVAAAIFSGCASSPDLGNVIPGEGGIYDVVATGEDNEEALSSALSSAKATCEQRQMRFVVIDRKEEYKGLVSEGTNNVINKAAEIVAATTATYVPTLSGEDDYRLTMRFKCES
jgi:hypothetical protein